jgi:hypothetical protein
VILRTFAGSFIVALAGLACGFLYDGGTGLALVAILAILEVSLSFDNAVVNATVLVRLNPFWQKIFLTVGVAIAVFGMRLVFPMLIVGITAKLTPGQALDLALQNGDPDKPGTYGYLLHQAHPAIAAFGGAFLLMIFLGFVLEEREITWLGWLERPLARIGKLDQLAVIVTVGALCLSAYLLAPSGKISTVLLAGSLGLISYIAVNGLGELFDTDSDSETDGDDEAEAAPPRAKRTTHAAGKAAFFLFLYLEVLDASFSFDGVIGAFAITSDPIIIAIGLGIGAMFIRSLTVLLVRKGTLAEYVYLEHGALWAIGALAVILLLTIRFDVPEVVTGLIGVAFIAAALASSVVRNKRAAESDGEVEIQPAHV